MIPSSGCIYCVAQLTSAAELRERRSFGDWVGAARQHGGYLAAASDLDGRAEFLIDKGLVTVGDIIQVAPRLTAINALPRERADYELARLLLLHDPPAWLGVAVDGRCVERAYIPDADIEYLSWIEPHLDDLLCDVFRELYPAKPEMKSEVGLAAELFVMDALRHTGLKPVHVALISDAYGYDIEVSRDTADRIEVKAASPRTAGTFHLSRNQYEKCRQHQDEWRVIQVVFSNDAFRSSRLDVTHIEGVYELSAAEVRAIVPLDTTSFKWEESALLSPPSESWQPWGLCPSPNFSIEGFSLPGSHRRDPR